MSYIGNSSTTQSFSSGTDYFSGNGSTTAFSLSRSVASVNDVVAVIENVVQQPSTAYTISGSTITFTSAPPTGTNNIYVRYMTTTTQVVTPSQNSVAYSSLNTDMQGALYAFKNRIINGAMVIDQRNTGAALTSVVNAFSVDRWRGQFDSSRVTMQQVSDAPAGFTNSLKITVTTPSTSNQSFVVQTIEGYNWADMQYGTSNAQTATLSFWVKSSIAGAYNATLEDSLGTRCYCAPYTISSTNTWEYKTLTIPGEPTGTNWNRTNGNGSQVIFDLGSASTQAANFWGTTDSKRATSSIQFANNNGATFYVTGVQLEKGSTATAFDYRPYGTELALCQRYYQKSYDVIVDKPGIITTAGEVRWQAAGTGGESCPTIMLPVVMRTTPTLTFYSPTTGTSGNARNYSTSADAAMTGTNTNGSRGWSGGAGFTAGHIVGYHYTASAEL